MEPTAETSPLERSRIALSKLLNPEQLEAATTTEGPLLVLAGAGSGKTRVLVHRVAHIVDAHLAYPREILAVTFTNKAAGEMRERLQKLIGRGASDAWIGTFHSIAGRILRRDGHRLGYTPSFSIYDTDDQKRVVKRIMQALNIETEGRGISISGVLTEIDRAKNHGLLPKDFAAQQKGFGFPVETAARRVYPRYQEELKKSNAMDFGDLLLLAVELLKHHPEVRDRLKRRFRYVLVDEFQDTNKVQFDLLKLITEDHHNLAVVGDDDQAIYRWRGAEVGNILGFPTLYPDAKVVKLEQNYRSTGNILSAANAIIQKNRQRHQKTLFTEEDAGLPIGVAMVAHGDDEAFLVAETIAARVRNGDDPGEFAILYRQNAQSRSFEEALRRARVPFTIVGGTGFYERREVRDLLAYLRLIANPSSSEDLERILNVPSRKIGDTTLERLRAAGEKAGVSGLAALELPTSTLEAEGIKGKTLERIQEFAKLIRELAEKAEQLSATEIAQQVVERTKYLAYLAESDPATAEDRVANVEELVSSIAEHEESYQELEPSPAAGEDDEGFGIAGARTPLSAFLDEASLVTTNDAPSGQSSVTMLTIHAAKGLEFKVVYLVGMEELTFPSRRAVEGDSGDLEEERRLCYVAVTRAMRELNLLAARYRRIYGSEEVRRPSRFLGDLPDSIVTSFGRPEEPRRSSAEPPRTAHRPPRLDVHYDVDEEAPPHRRAEPTLEVSDTRGYRPGSRVFHNTFGLGVVEAVSGEGQKAHLTIRFPTAGVRQVVARFVRAQEDS
ncbi:MAG: UvrD-helicase domain-containing protein [Myxococcota bacterium]